MLISKYKKKMLLIYSSKKKKYCLPINNKEMYLLTKDFSMRLQTWPDLKLLLLILSHYQLTYLCIRVTLTARSA